MGFLLNQNGFVLEGKKQTFWKEQVEGRQGSVKACVDEASTAVRVFHSFHK